MCVGKTGENFSKIPAVIFSSGDINKGLLLLKISIPCKLSRKTVENILIRKKLCFANDLKKYFFLFSSVSLPFYLFRQPLHPLKDSQYQFQSNGGWVGREHLFWRPQKKPSFPLGSVVTISRGPISIYSHKTISPPFLSLAPRSCSQSLFQTLSIIQR